MLVPLLLILAGFVLVLTGVTLLILGMLRGEKEEVKGGVVLVIGPLPVVFGSDEKTSSILMILAIVLTLLAVILFLLPWWRL
ncbi:MAG: DUF131 domain-containing protein [Desulfurococcus sp.]|nr:DUF131 domain-containing protein [Desulfurococcus sp.]